MSARIEWNQDVPELARKAVEPLLGRYLGVIPHWCTLRVLYDKEREGIPAEMYVSGEYRVAQLVLCPPILDCDEALRAEYILHELLHIPIMGMKSAYHGLMDALNLEQEQPIVFKMAKERMRQANEAATTDLTEALRRMGVTRT